MTSGGFGGFISLPGEFVLSSPSLVVSFVPCIMLCSICWSCWPYATLSRVELLMRVFFSSLL